MKRILLILGMLCILLNLPAYLTETASLEGFLIGTEINCDYFNWVSHIAEGIAVENYNIYAPFDRQTNGFGDYRVPSSSELNQWGDIIDLFLLGMLEEASSAIDQAGFPYQVVEFHDTDTGRMYYMLREVPDWDYYDDNGTPEPYDDVVGAFDWGWGLYIYSPSAQRPIIITVPHPNDDFPTPIIGYDGLTTWDASYLLISGAGREVRWSNVGSYTNSKSISDPTRSYNHPFNTAYRKFADKIRAETGHRELSVQLHSYDWNRHVGYTDNQISAGNGRLCPNLPIRDLSSLKQDIIHKGDHLMIPANTIGAHEDVFLNQYYSVYYSVHDFIYSDGEVEYPVNDMIDLPGYSQNRQMLYTLSGWNDNDVFEPFFHIEMDELPNAYDETENNYKWFYGWDENTGRWDFDRLYDHFRAYYSRWVNDLGELLDDLFEMDDELTPTMPDNLTVLNSSMYYVTLGWDATDSYDFDSYEILYATEPIGDDNYQIFDRDNASVLASPARTSINVTGLNSNFNYYFKIRARDKNGNYSLPSYEVTTAPAPANITSFSAHGMTNSVRVYWSVGSSSALQGFNIYRKELDANWEMIDSYLTNPQLLAGNNSYEYWDLSLPNSQHYQYRISMVNNSDYEFVHNVPQAAAPELVHELQISNASGNLTDSISFGQNPYATDGQDSYWDINKSNPSSNYVWLAFWQRYWSQYGTQLSREIKGGYDVSGEVKSWTVRVRSDQLNVPLFLSVPTASTRSEKIYLYDSGNGNWHDLQSGDYEFYVTNSSVRTMTLYWGNLQPSINHSFMDNQVFQGGDSIHFSWSNINPFLIDHVNLYVKNASDSLSILQESPAHITSYSFIIPQITDMPHSKAYLEVVATDGIRSTYPSPYTFAIVPRMNLLYTEPGWATKSNPFINESFLMPEVFGDGAMGYIWNDEWLGMNEYSFGPGYFVNATDYVFSNSTSDVLSGEAEYTMHQGWNFVANPHMCHYDISSLKFTVNGTDYRYSEMISQKMISRAVYVYRDGAYQMVDQIQPYEAFFIKSYANPLNNIVLGFYPYFDAPQIDPPAPYWSVSITADHENIDADMICIGSSAIASNGYDFRLDLPKAPEHDLFPALKFYLTPLNDDGFWDTNLQQEFRADFSDSECMQEYNFVLKSAEPGMVDFSSSLQSVPDEWTIRFYLDGGAWYVQDQGSYSHYLPEAGSYSGRIAIYNHPVSNENLIDSPVSRLKAYPNPFNPDVTISFNMPSAVDCNVDIYNIRGQKVKSLHKGLLSAGDHNLRWNGTDNKNRSVASGIYFARIKTPRQSRNIKMMLMK